MNRWSLAMTAMFAVATSTGAAAADDGRKDPCDPAMIMASLEYSTASELFDALAKIKNPRWRTLYRPTLGYTFPDRRRSAFWFGVTVSEFILASHARDAQRMSNLCRDLESFGRNLGVSQPLKDGIVRLNALAEKQDWAAAKKEIGAVTGRIVAALNNQEDGDLATLVLCGEWVRNVEIASSVVEPDSFEDLKMAAGGSGLFPVLAKAMKKSGLDSEKDERMSMLYRVATGIGDRWEESPGKGFTAEDVEATKNDVKGVLKAFSTR